MLFKKKKPPESENIRKFVDILYQFEMGHPDELYPPAIEPQLVVDCLCDVFLGTDWYTALPLNAKQVDTIILDEILRKHSKEFRKLVEEKQKEWKTSKS